MVVRRCDRPEDWPVCQRQVESCEGLRTDKCCLGFFSGQDAFERAEQLLMEINPNGKMARGLGQEVAANTAAAIRERWEDEPKKK